MNLSSKIEALLFYRAEPVSIKTLSKLLEVDREEVCRGIEELKESLSNRGVQLLTKDDEVELRTSPECSELIENIRKEELVRDLGKAGLETLSIVAYQGPVSRADIDYIRGVNSTFIIRNLLIRGLIDRVTNKGSRGFMYKPSFELLSFLGISNIEELPEFDTVKGELDAFYSGE